MGCAVCDLAESATVATWMTGAMAGCMRMRCDPAPNSNELDGLLAHSLQHAPVCCASHPLAPLPPLAPCLASPRVPLLLRCFHS
jgi:hypothetical protein